MTSVARSEFTAGLRRLADLIDGTPEIPTPEHAAIWFGIPGSDLQAFTALDLAEKALAAAEVPFEAGGATSTSRFVQINAGGVTYRFSHVATPPWDPTQQSSAQVVTA